MKQKRPPVPSSLTMRLFQPGMSPLHRAGLGGLATTLRAIERAYKRQQLAEDELPGAPWTNAEPPWRIDPLEITLDFGQPEHAKDFLQRLFRFAFHIRDGLMYLPGQYQQPPPVSVRAELQTALTLTFLQHGKVRTLAKNETPLTYHFDGKPLTVNVKFCSYYKHQDQWKNLVDGKGQLKTKPIEVIGPLNPGAVVRHVAFNARTRIEEKPERILPLYFALVGTLALAVNRGKGVLIVPEVNDLEAFASFRPLMTPTSEEQCRVTSAGDAALQAQIRLRGKEVIERNDLPACHAFTFQPTPWASQQKSRVESMFIPPGDDAQLSLFEKAMLELPPKVTSKVVKEFEGRGQNKITTERTEYFWVDSIVRPLVADNLALGRPWYQGFVDLFRKIDPVSKKPFRDRLFFEKKGLSAMIQQNAWNDSGESTVVNAVHEAMRNRYGQIASENEGNPVAMKKRFSGEYDRWRLAFAGAKTPEQFRHSLCDLFSRAGRNSVLTKEWHEILPMLHGRQWELTRDLALLALASYSGRSAEDLDNSESEESEESAQTS